jgi:hypothetical protein
MILGFMQKFPWKGEDKQPVPTNFREKILAGALLIPSTASRIGSKGLLHMIQHPKLHTMRLDPHNRWRAGMGIQMVYRGPKYSILDHFNKGIPELEECVSVQNIEIKWVD